MKDEKHAADAEGNVDVVPTFWAPQEYIARSSWFVFRLFLTQFLDRSSLAPDLHLPFLIFISFLPNLAHLPPFQVLNLTLIALPPSTRPTREYDIIFRWKFEVRELSSYTEGGHKYLVPRPYSVTD